MLGIMFSILVWTVSPQTPFIYIFLVFFASVFIDFDHYICAVNKTRKLGLLESFGYHKKREEELQKYEGKHGKTRGDFHIFHTIKFHSLMAILGILWIPVFYLFIGTTFHSFLDLFDMLAKGKIHRREYFFFNWLREKF